jgi:pSer/pThr/pTyr-binding forkhead associated (FHA) protein
MSAQFQLVMRSGPTPGKVFPLEADEVIVGRDATSGVAINDAEVSRKHAKLILHGSAYTIQDLGSTNGTFVNQQRITATQVLNPGDTVSFGEKIILQYEAAYDPNATMVAGSKQPVTALPVQKPAQAPASAPAQAPAPVYSGQVPSSPTPVAAQPKKKRTGLIIGIILVLLILVCLCVVLVAFFAPQSMLCAPGLRIIVNIIAPIFGYGVCP